MSSSPISAALTSPNSQGVSSIIEYTLSTFFPGYAHVSKRFPKLFTFASLLLAIYYFIPFDFFRRQWDRVSALLVSAVSVQTGDDLFEPMIEWLADQPNTIRANNHLAAKTNTPKTPGRGEDGYSSDPEQMQDRKSRAHNQPQIHYEHLEGFQIFIRNRTLFWTLQTRDSGDAWIAGSWRKVQTLTINTLGRSTAPIEKLIQDCYTAKWRAEHCNTIVRRPARGQYGQTMHWSRIASKAHRSLNTLYLRGDQSMQIVNDVENYLSSDTRSFYTERGIPYRRGYLLYGAPGCGKTSFTLALAAKFNLDVYIMTLLDRGLDDSTLITLLNSLPTPSILLLEDIDQAGLGRKTKRGRKHRMPDTKGAFDVARDFESSDDSDNDNHSSDTTTVTLSGLLNAIDGVAAPEGHILIMTTNAPDDLDEALVRAGRVNVKAEFNLASKDQARQMFIGMFPPDYILRKSHAAASLAHGGLASAATEKTAIDIATLAEGFVAEIEDGDLSPAELQDFLVSHKETPSAAVEGIRAFVESKRKERAEKEAKKLQLKTDKKERAAIRRKAYEDKKKAIVPENDDIDDETEAVRSDGDRTRSVTLVNGEAANDAGDELNDNEER